MAGTPYDLVIVLLRPAIILLYVYKHEIIIHFNLIVFDNGINLQYRNLTTWIWQMDILLL